MVYENGNLATLFSQFEMKETRTNDELQIVWGMKPEKKVLSMKICAACSRTLPKDQFSKKQWQLKQCTDHREVTETEVHPRHYRVLMLKTQDRDLFRQPPPTDECPICCVCLPLSIAMIQYQAVVAKFYAWGAFTTSFVPSAKFLNTLQTGNKSKG